MRTLKRAIQEILSSIWDSLSCLDEVATENLIEMLLSSQQVFLYAVGRSGLATKALAQRLMHLGLKAFIIGEATTPTMREGDLLIVISGSGETLPVILAARMAKEAGARVAAITSNPSSTIASISDLIILIKVECKEEHTSLAPMGTIFEAAAWIFGDSLIAELMSQLGQSEQDMKSRHANVQA